MIRGAAPVLNRSGQPTVHDFEGGLLTQLARLVQPRHNWPLLIALTLLYGLLVTLGCYLLARKTAGRWPPLLAFLVLVVGFSAGFGAIGRQGYGQGAVYTLSYARPVGDRTFDVTQWISAFVTHGAEYEVKHAAAHSLYTIYPDTESVRALIHSGKDGTVRVDMPICSRQSFVHRGKMTGDDLALRVVSWADGAGPEKLILASGPGFPQQPLGLWAVQGQRVYPLRLANGQVRAGGAPAAPLAEFIGPGLTALQNASGYAYAGIGGRDGGRPDPAAAEGVFRNLLWPVLARGLGGSKDFRCSVTVPESAAEAAERVEVFVFARSPDGFRIGGDRFGREVGYTLYHLQVRRERGPATAARAGG